jgi:hypothetical protein
MSAVILGCVFEGRFPDVSNYYSFFFFFGMLTLKRRTVQYLEVFGNSNPNDKA